MKARWLRVIAVVALVALMVSAVAVAGKTNTKKGQVYFKNNCRVCHDGKSSAPTLTPMAKTIALWEKAFAKGGTVTGKCVARVKEKTGTDLTEQDLADMQAYLVKHAADSDQPATCGN